MRLPFQIHEYLRTSRFDNRSVRDSHAPIRTHKQYPRMERTRLSAMRPLEKPLGDVLNARSSNKTGTSTISLESMSDLLGHSLGVREGGSRRYPSGGALYPMETYIVAYDVAELTSGVYHYDPTEHALEHLWDISNNSKDNSLIRDASYKPGAVILLTGMWERSCRKYGDFGYYLGMLEAGHMAQNLLLVASALEMAATPLGGGFDEKAASELLDLDLSLEQPVYAISLDGGTV